MGPVLSHPVTQGEGLHNLGVPVPLTQRIPSPPPHQPCHRKKCLEEERSCLFLF